MKAPLVSIVIPCYNAERYVGEAIQSALDQTYPHKEVIVIDDGSTDGSLEVIRSFGNQIRWQTGPNRGGSAARNRGIELARGVLIQFLDADDLLHPRKLDIQVDTALRVQPQIVVCDGEIDSGNGEIRVYSLASDIDDPVELALREWISTPSPLHWREKLIQIGGFRENLPCSQERDLHLRLACAGAQFHHLPETLLTVRRVAGSVSSNYIHVLDQHANIAWCAHEMLRKSGRLSEERALALAAFLAKDARHYLQRGQPEKARDYFVQAARIHETAGIPLAYGWLSRMLLRVAGPKRTETVVGWKRRLMRSYASR